MSQGLYIRHGLLPRLPIYLVNVARDVLMDRLQGDRLHSTPIEPTARIWRSWRTLMPVPWVSRARSIAAIFSAMAQQKASSSITVANVSAMLTLLRPVTSVP